MTRSTGSSITLQAKRAIAPLLCSRPVGKVVEFVTRGRVPTRGIVFDATMPTFSPSIKAAMLFGIYEAAEIRFVQKHLGPDVDVVELGAGLGVTSAHILNVLAPGRSLTCVEANPDLLPALTRTVHDAESRSRRKAEVVHGAIAATSLDRSSTTVRLTTSASSLGSAVMEGRPQLGETVEVPRVTLSTLVEGLDDYALVVDIEGAEASLINHDAAAVRNAQQIVIELHPTVYAGRRVSVEELARQLLDDFEFELIERRGPVLACAH